MARTTHFTFVSVSLGHLGQVFGSTDFQDEKTFAKMLLAPFKFDPLFTRARYITLHDLLECIKWFMGLWEWGWVQTQFSVLRLYF